MPDTFHNKKQIALILGGSSGMGLAAAKNLQQKECIFISVYRDPKLLKAAFRNH
jgi:NAD(P)-dependent dehydrogenase (short-subunit alcohol dehydrogenase family)